MGWSAGLDARGGPKSTMLSMKKTLSTKPSGLRLRRCRERSGDGLRGVVGGFAGDECLFCCRSNTGSSGEPQAIQTRVKVAERLELG